MGVDQALVHIDTTAIMPSSYGKAIATEVTAIDPINAIPVVVKTVIRIVAKIAVKAAVMAADYFPIFMDCLAELGQTVVANGTPPIMVTAAP